MLAELLNLKMHHVLVILTFCIYGNEIQTVCESMCQKLSQSSERENHDHHVFLGRITSDK